MQILTVISTAQSQWTNEIRIMKFTTIFKAFECLFLSLVTHQLNIMIKFQSSILKQNSMQSFSTTSNFQLNWQCIIYTVYYLNYNDLILKITGKNYFFCETFMHVSNNCTSQHEFSNKTCDGKCIAFGLHIWVFDFCSMKHIFYRKLNSIFTKKLNILFCSKFKTLINKCKNYEFFIKKCC